jgi:transposase-like protein
MLAMKAEQKVDAAGGRGAERAEGERSAAVAGRELAKQVPDPELVEQPRRRRFTAKYKLRIVQEADACTRPGEIGALLRREGLYSSHLGTWRKQRDEGALLSLGRPRGRKKAHPLEAENARLKQRAERAETELAKARKVMEVQGNVSALLAELLEAEGATTNGSSEP